MEVHRKGDHFWIDMAGQERRHSNGLPIWKIWGDMRKVAERQVEMPKWLKEINMGKDTQARLVLVVDYDNIPSYQDIEELVEKAREVGGTSLADLYILAPTKQSFV